MISFEIPEHLDTKFHDWSLLEKWINECVESEGFGVGDLGYVFMTDDELLQYNRDFLNHDYYTDIITFDNSDLPKVSADILMSVERVFDNSKELGNSYIDEFCRVIIHGVIHLMGYKDKTDEEAVVMRQMEDKLLNLRCFT
jgi:rRNA maturation RNase YbeY